MAVLLVKSAQEAAKGLDDTLKRLLTVAEVSPLTAEILVEAGQHRTTYGLRFQDAVVLASVSRHLASTPAPSCFLNRNTRDFNDPSIITALDAQGCKLLGSFVDGLAWIRRALAP